MSVEISCRTDNNEIFHYPRHYPDQKNILLPYYLIPTAQTTLNNIGAGTLQTRTLTIYLSENLKLTDVLNNYSTF